jgi:hypothetical protein
MKNIIAVMLTVVMMAGICSAADRGPSTPDERERAVRAAALLQTDPLSATARSEREWGILWLIQVPDVSVSMCLHPKEPRKYKFSGELTAAHMMSMAAFVIQNPAQAKDQSAMWRAGTEGMLRAYEAMVKENPKAKNAWYDALLQQRDLESLRSYLADLAANCKGSAGTLAVQN